MEMCGSSREKSGAPPSAVCTCTSWLVFTLIRACGGGAILAVGLAPDFAAQHGNIVIDGGGRAGAGPAGLAVGELVGVVELIGADARLHFEPARASVAAGEERAVGAGDFGILAGPRRCS